MADLLFIEEVMEAPFEYGVFEWLSVATGLRFSFEQNQMERHREQLQEAIAYEQPISHLLGIEEALRAQYVYLPLFIGYEEVTKPNKFEACKLRIPAIATYTDFGLLTVVSPFDANRIIIF